LSESCAAIGALEAQLDAVSTWARLLAQHLSVGGRLLVAGNGGSAALAQHLVAELVGRYQDERPPFDALALTADSAIVTALGNDYGYDQCFVRQVNAHGRRGDIFLALSTSGRSPNLLRAAEAARRAAMRCWAVTGPSDSPLASAAETIQLQGASTAAVQEAQQVVVHLLCAAFDRYVGGGR
jgi:D-sedoheptulose 7-phosphate isomerase